MPFRWEDCLEGHVLLGMILSLASLNLLLLTTFSTPFIKGIYFLHSDGSQYGAFGYCIDGAGCSGTAVGYDTGAEVIGWLTKTQILWGISTLFMFLALLALILGLLRVGKFTRSPIYFRTTAFLGTLTGIFATIFSLILWVTARRRYDAEGVRGTYGAALFLGLAGTILAFAAACIGGPAYAGNYGMHWANRDVAYNV